MIDRLLALLGLRRTSPATPAPAPTPEPTSEPASSEVVLSEQHDDRFLGPELQAEFWSAFATDVPDRRSRAAAVYLTIYRIQSGEFGET